MSTKLPLTTPLAEDNSLFRDLYTRMLRQIQMDAHNVVGVTSSVDGEGKTTIAINLAITLANDHGLVDSGKRSGEILIVDCNPGTVGTSQGLMVESIPGLIHYLRHQYPVDGIVKQVFLPRLWVMPVGSSPFDFSPLIRTEVMKELIATLRERFEVIILDLPSILTTTDTLVLAGLADQLLLVVRSGVTPSAVLGQALERLNRDKLAGMVLNDYHRPLPRWLEKAV
jgi:Mrp family chromosome partitioning ATPase